ncbi:MAG: response regulator [candidate division Zixibacteria bacterium]|nr:response regulator [candidate division Zixibacteria bacterium]
MSENGSFVVAIVDDEPMVTQSIKNFLSLETDYEILSFNSPQEALETLKDRPVDVIISDYLMPDINGIELLLQLKEIQPQATRILLTGYADKENAIKAINDVGLYQYIEKPWENEDLKLIIRNGIEKRVLLRRLADKVQELDKASAELKGVYSDLLKAFK